MSRIFLSVPGPLQNTCLSGFLEASCEHQIQLCADATGDLCNCFNIHWCKALLCDPRPDYFAMLHTDVAPPFAWIDMLIDELDAVDADIMTTVLPIKDERGLTSTGIRHGTYTRRFTMTEISELPETFGRVDTDLPDLPLAINTGLWVCEFDRWADTFPGFHNRHSIQTINGVRSPCVISEDWTFSDWAFEQGLAVYATRKIEATHRGPYDYPNQGSWGQWKRDEDFFSNLMEVHSDGSKLR